jgi:ArsR family transcriptional regulator, arsenate/arsenite/antimonite-responsive transcriptional repressor
MLPTGSEGTRTASAVYASFFKALGDATRLEIVSLLGAAGSPLCACEIEARFALSQPTISHHLRLLREAGVVTSERRGSWVYYALDPGATTRIESFRALLAQRA